MLIISSDKNGVQDKDFFELVFLHIVNQSKTLGRSRANFVYLSTSPVNASRKLSATPNKRFYPVFLWICPCSKKSKCCLGGTIPLLLIAYTQYTRQLEILVTALQQHKGRLIVSTIRTTIAMGFCCENKKRPSTLLLCFLWSV